MHHTDVSQCVTKQTCCPGAESTAVGYPLSNEPDLAQDLKMLIKNLFKLLQEQHPKAVEALLVSGADAWQAVQLQLQQESQSSKRMRLQRDGFVHSVLLALETNLWSTNTEAIFCFCLRQQVLCSCIYPRKENMHCSDCELIVREMQISSNMNLARLAGDPATDDNAEIPYIISALDVYTRVCWSPCCDCCQTMQLLGQAFCSFGSAHHMHCIFAGCCVSMSCQ